MTSKNLTPEETLKKRLSELREKGSLDDLTDEERKHYAYFQSRLRENTNEGLTDTEYDHLARMELFLHNYNKLSKTVPIADMDNTLMDIARKYRDKLLTVMEKARKGGDKPKPLFDELKELAVQMETEGGGIVSMEFRAPDTIDEGKQKPEKVEE